MSRCTSAVRTSSRVFSAFLSLCLPLAAVLASGAWAQSTQPQATVPVTPGQAASQQKLPAVTTTVTVRGETKDNYLPEAATVGTLDGLPLQQTPLSVTVMTRDLLNDQVSRLLSDVIRNDASVGDDYVPVGYYGVYQMRGFPIDLATGLEINGLPVAGEQDVPLENKQSVEFLKGIAGIESGVASAAGLIDYVTKRPANIQAIDLATDHRGTAYGAVDMGHLFGSRKQVGARVNLGAERIVPYMNDTNGWRAVGAGSADWKIDSATTLKGDFEYQHKNERDGSGYQLLGGTVIPDINRIYRSTMLGDQPWGLADTYDTFNASARIDGTLSPSWLAYVAGSFSHSLIQDNVIYVYGCYYENECSTGSAPYWFFSPDGTYDMYDYRNPDELRIDAQAEAMVTGHIRTGVFTHDVTGGGILFLRSVHQPGFYTHQDPYDPSGVVQDGSVYTYVGSANIYQPIPAVSAPGAADSLEDPYQNAGPRRLWLDSHQAAAVIQDRIHVPGNIQLIAAGRYDSLRDHNYSAYASCPDFAVAGGCDPNFTDKGVWLPQFAATYTPVPSLTIYSNYGVLLSLGPQAPFWAGNGSQYLSPFYTRQAEIGAKYEPGQRILLTAAFFRMRTPFFYPKLILAPDATCGDDEFDPTSSSNLCFESEGRETHSGIELNAAGKATNWLRLNGSLAATRAVSDNTGTPSYDDKQVLNVPHLRTALSADLSVPHMRGLHLLPGWSYTGRKEATRDDMVSVPGYNLLNLGARYTPGGEEGHVSFRIFADNIANKRYWSDTGSNAGDSYIWLGAPPTVRLSAHYTF